MTIEQQLRALETPAFKRALTALSSERPMGLITVGRMDSWLRRNIDAEAASAWAVYRDTENLLP